MSSAPFVAGHKLLYTTDQAIKELQASLPVGSRGFPYAYWALYRWHNGTEHAANLPPLSSLIHNLYLLSLLDDARRVREMLMGLSREGHFADRPSTWWNDNWLPILGNGAGDYWCLDLSIEHGGRVIRFLHDDPRRKVLFQDLGAFIEAYSESIDRGMWKIDPDDRLMEPADWNAWEDLCSEFGASGYVEP